MFRKISLFIIAPLFVLFGAAAPAFASSTPTSTQHTVNVSVNSVITITGLTDVAFNGNPGQTLTGSGYTGPNMCNTPTQSGVACTESYSVASNDGLGYSLSETAFAAQFTSTTETTVIPDSAWTITPEVNLLGSTLVPFSPNTTAHTIYSTTSGPSTDTVGEVWTLNMPTTLAAGAYTNQLTYIATGN